MNDLEARVRDAYTAADSWGPQTPPPLELSHKQPLLAPIAAAIAVVAIVTGAVLFATRPGKPDSKPVAVAPKGAQAAVFLCARTSANPVCHRADVTPAQRAAVRARLAGMREVRSIVYESKRQAYESFRERFKAVEGSVRMGDLPEAFRIEMAKVEDFRKLVTMVGPMPGVDQIIRER